jgi:hypothetical protein
MILKICVLQTGLKLMLDSSEEDFLVTLLVSLSKIASKSTILLSEQVPFHFLIVIFCLCCCWRSKVHVCKIFLSAFS